MAGVATPATKTAAGLAGLRRKDATEGRFERGWARSDTGGAAHPTATLARAGAGCNDDGVERGGRPERALAGIGLRGSARAADTRVGPRDPQEHDAVLGRM